MRRSFLLVLTTVAALACADAAAPRPHAQADQKVRETLLSLGTVAPAPDSATPIHTRPAISFSSYDPCSGDTVVVTGTYKQDGWELNRPDHHASDTFGQSDNGMLGVGKQTGAVYDVLYYNHQTIDYGATTSDHYVATVHKFWLLTNRDTWKASIVASKYTITLNPFVVTGDPAFSFSQCYAW